MKQHRPSLFILSSSFPSSRDDETCGYVREFAQAMALEFDVEVLVPADAKASDTGNIIGNDTNQDVFHLKRSKSFLPSRLDPLQAGRDLNSLVRGNLLIKVLTLISLFAFFIKALKSARHADVICSHWMLPSGLIGAILAGLFHKPHIVIEHSGALHLLMQIPAGRRLARFIVRRSQRLITVSSDLKNKLIALCPEAKGKTEVIAMGISFAALNQRLADEAETRGLPACHVSKAEIATPESKILFIGRLVDIKGVEVLLKALATLPGGQLLVAGDGNQRMALENLAEKLKVSAEFLGIVGKAERAQLFASSTILVIPSLVLPDGRTEGMPVVALEALAFGLPVIASGVGGLSEIVIDGQNGLLFEAGNHLLLADKIRLLLDDKELRERLSGNGRQTAEAFDWQIIGTKFSEIIKDSLSTNGSVESYQTASDPKL
jgi:glycosyltransferase involved in cell wall biosynthesis